MRISWDKNECFLSKKHNHSVIIEQNDGIDVTDYVVTKETSKGGNYILHKNYRFVKSGTNNDKIHYRCSLYTKQCKARMSVVGKRTFMHLEHNHEATE